VTGCASWAEQKLRSGTWAVVETRLRSRSTLWPSEWESRLMAAVRSALSHGP